MRGRILLIFGLALVPIAVGILYVIAQTSARERDLANRQMQRWARIMADHHVQMVRSTHLMLTALARTNEVRSGDTVACSRLVKALRDSFPQYVNLGAIEANGRLSCSARPGDAHDLSDRRYFRDAIQRRALAGGDYQIGRITRQASVNYAFPVMVDGARVERVVFAALDLNWFNELPRRLDVPDGTSLLLLDVNNRVVYRYPDGERWMGKRLVDEPVLRALREYQASGIAEAVGLDGVRRLYAYAVVNPVANSPLRFAVGIPVRQAFALRNHLQNTAAAFLLLFMLGTLAIAWFLSDRFIVRRLDAIYEATNKLARGDLAARTGVRGGTDELSQLARSFDTMASALQANHTQLARNESNERFLAEATQVLSSSLDYEQTLRSLAELSVSRFADWCSIDLPADGNRDRFRYVYHRDPHKRDLALQLERRYPDDDANSPNKQVVATGEPILISRVPPEMLAAAARDEEHHALLKQLGLCSALIVPLRTTGAPFGALTLITAEADREFDEQDLFLAVELGRRAALAVENARLYADLEMRVRERTAELSAVNRELEAFSYSVSHDLRSPLRSLDGFSQAVAEDYGHSLDAQGKDYLERIRNGAQRMGRLIDDLLSLARVTRMDLVRTRVDVTALAHSVVQELKASTPERSVEIVIATDMVANADPGLLRIVLENLVGNAWKFTAKTSQPCIEIGWRSNETPNVFFVRDNGAGFDMTYADKLFGPFQRLHGMTEFSGTGIGLATVQRIIARHGGRIWGDARVNEGATFYFTLEAGYARNDSAG